MGFDIELAILPKEKTLIGLGWQSGSADHNGKPTVFHEIGIGIGVIVLYLTFFKKGRS
jgi:hypothetical protein